MPYNTQKEWQKDFDIKEAPLRAIDEKLNAFAKVNRMVISKNYHDFPVRSIEWKSNGINKKIQIYLDDWNKEVFNLWIVAYRDILWIKRFMKTMFLKKSVSIHDIVNNLETLLNDAKITLDSWSKDQLEEIKNDPGNSGLIPGANSGR